MSVDPQDGHPLALVGDMAGYRADGPHGDAVISPDDERALPFRQGSERLVVDSLNPARHLLGMVAQMRDVPRWLHLRGGWGDVPAVDDLMGKEGKRIGQACNPCGGGTQGCPGYAGRKTEGNANKANGFGGGWTSCW
jgi:hypothetical protein